MKKIISVILAVITSTAVFVGTGTRSIGYPGDCNGDGTVDNKDVVVLFRYVSGNTAGAVPENCDYNRDGEINNKDVTSLFRALSSGTVPVEPVSDDMTSDIALKDYDFLTQISDVKYEFTGIDSSNGAFALHRDASANGNTVTFPKGSVGGIYPTFSVSPDSVTEYTFEVKSASPSSAYSWFTCYFGLRLVREQADPTSNTGVWIAMRSKQLGLRTNAWPETTYFNIDYDFSKGVLITVKDDPVNNIVYIYAGAEKQEIATVQLDGKNVKLIKSGGGKTISTKTDNDVITGGYAHIWGHIPEDDITVKNISVSTKRETGTVDNNGIKTNSRDIFSDTWTARDDTGRVITTSSNKPNGSKVGIFYFLWHETSNNRMPIYDHTASYLKGGMDELWKTMTSGNLGFAHYWAEPYFGYYASNDEWVIRKHGAMLAEAGIDFVFFDVTNGPLYPTSYEAVLRVWAKMRSEGLRTPDVCFLAQDGNTSELSTLWTNIYSINLYEDLWFKWNGKPVIMFTNNNTTLTKEQKDFFTVKYSWANENDGWYSWKFGIDCWAWGTMYPQKGGYVRENGKRKLEQMVVMCGFWANGSYGTNAGRSYTSKTGEPKTDSDWDMGYALYPETSGLGLAYQEQFDRALASSPKIIMITGWNEWWAGRWEGDAAGQLIANEYTVVKDSTAKEYNYYVDNLDPEYSRDIEPMRDGFKDNYYYQTVKNVREYKGTRQVESAFGQKTIDINGSATQWNTVGPEYRDVTGDVTHRNHLSHVGKLTYKNDTGRNDIITAKVSSDFDYLYFYVECADEITKPEGENWMNLYLNTDENDENGWYGFDFVINRERSNGKASVMSFEDGWNLKKVGEAEYELNKKILTIKLEKKTINEKSNGKTFYFKWADNSVNDGDIMEFLDKGDAAPDGRFCYHYTAEATETVIPDCLTEDMAVFKANGYNAFINGESVRLSGNNTKAVLLASGYEYYLPVNVLEKLGIKCGNEKKYNHYGASYVKANEIVEKSGKAVTITPDGLLVISNSRITDTETLDTLYRSLY